MSKRLFRMHKAYTAASKYSPMSIMLNTTVASSLKATTRYHSNRTSNLWLSISSGEILWDISSASLAASTFGFPTWCGENRIWRFRFDVSTISLSIKISFLTPSLASDIATPQPRPPVPSSKHTYCWTLSYFHFYTLTCLSNTPPLSVSSCDFNHSWAYSVFVTIIIIN